MRLGERPAWAAAFDSFTRWLDLPHTGRRLRCAGEMSGATAFYVGGGQEPPVFQAWGKSVGCVLKLMAPGLWRCDAGPHFDL